MNFSTEKLDEYLNTNSQNEPSLLNQLYRETNLKILEEFSFMK